MSDRRLRALFIATVAATLTFAIGGCASPARTAAPQSAATVTAAPIASVPATPQVDYAGFWCDSANAPRKVMSPDGISELQVIAADATSVSFTLTRTGPAPGYRIVSSATTITAPLASGVAHFTFDDDRGGVNRGDLELLEAGILIRVKGGSGHPDAPIQMDCLMRRDPYHATRTIEEPAVVQKFIGVPGNYNRASDPVPDIPSINVGSRAGNTVPLSITGTSTRHVYFSGLSGKVVTSRDLEVRLTGTDCDLLLHWGDPGTVTVSRISGSLPRNLKALTQDPTYWNSKYLHTN